MRLTYLIALFALFNIDMTESRPVPNDEESGSGALQLLTLIAIVGIIGSTIYWVQQHNDKKAMAAAEKLDGVKLNSEEIKNLDFKKIKKELKVVKKTGVFGDHLMQLLESYNTASGKAIIEQARSAPHDIVLPDGTKVTPAQAENVGKAVTETPGMSPAQYNEALKSTAETPAQKAARQEANKSMIEKFQAKATPLINSQFLKQLNTANPDSKGLKQYMERLNYLKTLETDPKKLNNVKTEKLERSIKTVGKMTTLISEELVKHMSTDAPPEVRKALGELRKAGASMQNVKQKKSNVDFTSTMKVLNALDATPLKGITVETIKATARTPAKI